MPEPPRRTTFDPARARATGFHPRTVVVLRGSRLRAALRLALDRAPAGLTLSDMERILESQGLGVEGRFSKVASDALAVEVGRGRVVRISRGHYRGRLTKQARHRLRGRVADSISAAHEGRRVPR